MGLRITTAMAALRLLVVNGNTNQAVTRVVAEAARAAAGVDTVIVPVTAAFGVPVVQTRADHGLAYRACLDAVQRHAAGCDAVLIAVSLDTAVEELQRGCPVPVVGMTDAALTAATALGSAIGVLTIGETMKTLFLERFGAARASLVQAIDLTPAQVLEHRAQAAVLLAQGVRRLTARGAGVVVPVGATVAGLAAVIAPVAKVPVLDSVGCGVRLAEQRVRAARARGLQ